MFSVCIFLIPEILNPISVYRKVLPSLGRRFRLYEDLGAVVCWQVAPFWFWFLVGEFLFQTKNREFLISSAGFSMSNVYPECTLRWIRVLKISILVGRTCSCQRTAVRSCRRLIFPPFFPSREKEELKQLHRKETKINQNLTHKSHPHSSPRRPNLRPNT